MMEVPNLWPQDLQPQGALSPIGILRSQATLLHRTTSGLLYCEVGTEVENGQFVHHLNIVAPALGDFQYELVTVRHGIDGYPASVKAGKKQWGGHHVVRNDQELQEWLKSQFESQKQVVEKLWAESLPQSELAHT